MPQEATEPPPEHTRHRFLLLDAMRGVAAIAVAIYHGHGIFGRELVPHGYLAVDFFFFLSGFIIQYAYGAQLDRGMPFATFLKLRVARLYPLYCIILLASVAPVAVHLHLPFTPWERLLVKVSLFGLFLIPVRSVLIASFPFNPSAWSLCQEFLANILHAVFLRRRCTRTLLVWMFLMAALDVWAAKLHNTFDYGWFGFDAVLFPCRAFFPYIGGMLLFRWWSSQPKRPIPAWIPSLALTAVFLVPRPHTRPYILDSLLVVLVFPAVLLLGACAPVRGRLQASAVFLGVLSYPLYLVHRPLLDAVQGNFHLVDRTVVTSRNLAEGAAFVLTAITLAIGLEFLFDRPLRKYLRHRLAQG